jgi:hypothetical protein
MARCRFVQPDKVRLLLSEGYWIEVKKQLSVGEIRDAGQAAAGAVNPEGWFKPNLQMAGLAQIVAYLLDWNLTDAAGKVVAIEGNDTAKLAALRQLDTASFNEVDAAIETHILAQMVADEAEKKMTRGDEDSAVTLPFVKP